MLVDLEGWRSAQGLGFASFRVDDDAWQGHTGSLHGYRAIHLFRAADGLGVVALTNGSDRPNPVAHTAARALLAAHRADRPAPRPRPPVAATPGTGPTGRWAQRTLAVECTVWLDGEDLLWMDTSDPEPIRMRPTGESHTWTIRDDHAGEGELVRWVPATDDHPELLQDGAWSMDRVTD